MAARTIWTEEEKQDIINLYKKGYSQQAIAKKYKKDSTVIKKVLIAANLPIRSAKESKELSLRLPPLTDTQEISRQLLQSIVDQYVCEKKSVYQIRKETGISEYYIEKALKEAQVKKRTYVDAKQIGRKYTLDDDFFKTQNHDMAYVLGLLASDGNVSKEENGVFIELERTDEYLLEQIRELTNNSRPLSHYTHKHQNGSDTEAVSFKAWSAEWKKDLAIYNIVPAKTFILKPPTYLNKKYFISYLKGYFDGDGTIHVHPKTNKGDVKFCGASYEVIRWIKDVLVNQYGIISGTIQESTLKSGHKFYELTISNRAGITKLYDLWYKTKETSSICLMRKKEKFEKYLYSNLPRDFDSMVME